MTPRLPVAGSAPPVVITCRCFSVIAWCWMDDSDNRDNKRNNGSLVPCNLLFSISIIEPINVRRVSLLKEARRKRSLTVELPAQAQHGGDWRWCRWAEGDLPVHDFFLFFFFGCSFEKQEHMLFVCLCITCLYVFHFQQRSDKHLWSAAHFLSSLHLLCSRHSLIDSLQAGAGFPWQPFLLPCLCQKAQLLTSPFSLAILSHTSPHITLRWLLKRSPAARGSTFPCDLNP